MLIDTQDVSKWFVVNRGFKVYPICTACGKDGVVYFRAYRKGYFGIAPKCSCCNKLYPVRFKKNSEPLNHCRQFGQ